MTFANPSYLWALAGLAIPLAIHLLSRKEGKVIRVGSIRHVEESNTSQFKSIRLNEILLLLLRMLMVILLAFFMSGAQCSSADTARKIAYVEDGIQADSLISSGYEIHEIPAGSYWSFAEELNKSSFETVVVSRSKAENFRGKRIALNDNIKWITAEPASREYQALAWKAGDSVFVRTGRSSAQVTSFSTRVAVPDSIKVIEPHAISIQAKDPIVVAALNVLRKEYKLPIQITNSEYRIMSNEGIGPLVERVSPTEIRVNKKLDQDIALNENLVMEIFKVLYPELQKPEINADGRVMPDEFMWSQIVTSSSPLIFTSSGIEKYLILLFLLALSTERFFAIRRNQ